jgi:hypothetical protein
MRYLTLGELIELHRRIIQQSGNSDVSSNGLGVRVIAKW